MTQTAQPTYSIKEAAPILGVGERRLYALLREQNATDDQNRPKQSHIRHGYLKADTKSYNHPVSGSRCWYATTLITSDGMDWLHKLIAKKENAA